MEERWKKNRRKVAAFGERWKELIYGQRIDKCSKGIRDGVGT